MNILKSSSRCIHLLGLLLAAGCAGAAGTEMVYYPVNPSFGGNPNNASGLLSVAQAQNHNKAPVDSPLKSFNDNLQRAIFSRLQADAVTALFKSSAGLQPGTYDTANFTIKVTDIHDGSLTVETTDKSSGATATFTVSSGNYNADTTAQ